VTRRTEALLGAFARWIDEGAPTPRVDRKEAVAITRHLHAELDRGVEARRGQIEQAGHAIACARGCNSCCEQVVVVLEPEAAAVAGWLAEPGQAARRARFDAAHRAWRERGGELIEQAVEAAVVQDPAAQSATARGTFAAHLMCPFNHDGGCDIYPVRPAVCREKEAVDSQEPCRQLDGTPRVPDWMPIERFMDRIRDVADAMHAAIAPPPHRPFALADRVAALLAERDRPVPGRNDPCPCGSGKKHKKCCGADG
jgi:hypothetical protein